MRRLEKLGMKRNWIYEVIVSTFQNKDPHSAPIGVWTENLSELNMNIYKESKTLENILTQKEFTANFVSDISIFYNSLFAKNEVTYINSKQINAPAIKNSSAIVELKLQEITEKKSTFQIKAQVINIHIMDDLKLVNRAENLVLESLILVTRIPFFSEEEIKKALKENFRVIKKVAPDSKFQNIMEKILTGFHFTIVDGH
jgi:hypothetical protein